MKDDEFSVTRDEEYTRVALEMGRPPLVCNCNECICELHRYEGTKLCIWCANGDHGDEVKTIECDECNEEFPEHTKKVIPDGVTREWYVCPDCYDRLEKEGKV